jgi:hypothetical protein
VISISDALPSNASRKPIFYCPKNLMYNQHNC